MWRYISVTSYRVFISVLKGTIILENPQKTTIIVVENIVPRFLVHGVHEILNNCCDNIQLKIDGGT